MKKRQEIKRTPRDDRGRKAAELSPTMLRQVRGGDMNEPSQIGQSYQTNGWRMNAGTLVTT